MIRPCTLCAALFVAALAVTATACEPPPVKAPGVRPEAGACTLVLEVTGMT